MLPYGIKIHVVRREQMKTTEDHPITPDKDDICLPPSARGVTRKHMRSVGTIALPWGPVIEAGFGAAYHIGSDTYPITIVGWSTSGKTLYYQRAKAHPTKGSDFYGDQTYLYSVNPSALLEVATYRTGKQDSGSYYDRRSDKRVEYAGTYRPKGSKTGYLSFRGYGCRLDPHR
jgi:hypothetical protein